VAELGDRGEPPAESAFEELWGQLKRLVRREVQRRGLGDAPPRFLGLHGWESWSDEALEELTADAYTFNFVHRLRSLRAQLAHKDNIDGLVVRNVRNLLFERQREHDPMGFRVFEILRRALRQLVARGHLRILAGSEDIRNDTVAAFVPKGREASATLQIAAPPEIEGVSSRWGDELFAELVLSRGPDKERAVLRLARQVHRLSEKGIVAFRVRALADPLKAAVRSRWSQLYFEEQGDEVISNPGAWDESRRQVRQLVRVEHPKCRFEEYQSFRRLTACVARLLEEEPVRVRTRQYLADLWQFLRIHVIQDEELPSQRALAESLSIPRDRFTELFSILGRLLDRCRSHLAGSVPPSGPEGANRKEEEGST
jgi:hypothetical protein